MPSATSTARSQTRPTSCAQPSATAHPTPAGAPTGTAARAVVGYRFDHEVSGDGPLGDRPGDRAARADWNAARRELDRAQRALGRQRGREREQAGHDLGLG